MFFTGHFATQHGFRGATPQETEHLEVLVHGSHRGQPIARGTDFTANGVYDKE